MVAVYVEGRNRKFLWNFGTYTTLMLKEEAEDFSGILGPTRLLCRRKKQKISLEFWHLHDSYVEGRSRRFLWNFGTYTTPMLKEHAEDFSGILAPTRLLCWRRSRRFILKFVTYMMSCTKIHTKYQPGMLKPENRISYKPMNIQNFYAVIIFIFTSLLS